MATTHKQTNSKLGKELPSPVPFLLGVTFEIFSYRKPFSIFTEVFFFCNSNIRNFIFGMILLADVGFPCVPSCRWYAFGSSWQEGFQRVLDVWRVGVLSFFQKKLLLLKVMLQLQKGVLGFWHWVATALWVFWKINKNWIWASKQLDFRKFCFQVKSFSGVRTCLLTVVFVFTGSHH